MDEAKLEQFMGKIVTDMAAAQTLLVMTIGERLGLYQALATSGPVTSAELATKTGLDERYLREWLSQQAVSGYVTYDATSQKFELPEEHAFALANEDSPVYVAGSFDVLGAIWAAEDKVIEAFRSGGGIGWHEHHPRLFSGVEKFFRPGYRANLTSSWIPALDGVEDRLRSGIDVADVGCGHGASTIVMALEYPQSRFVGFDYHQPSIDAANKAAADAGVADRVRFDVASASSYAGNFDLICFFDCLHDMGDPLGAAKYAKSHLNDGGTILLVEPFATDKLEDSIGSPVATLFYGSSISICTPASKSQDVGLGLGAQAGAARLRELFTEAGYGSFRRATETPFNLVLEAKV